MKAIDPKTFGEFAPFARRIMENKNYVHEKGGGVRETWSEAAERVGHFVTNDYLPEITGPVTRLIADRQFMPGGRYMYASARDKPMLNNCCLLGADDSREGWADLMYKSACSLMVGAGVGVTYSDLRPENAHIRGLGGKSTGPLALMNMVNEAGRYIIQGGSRRAAIWAGLSWRHPDVMKFIRMKDHEKDIRSHKEQNPHFPVPMEGTNISVGLDDDFFAAYFDPAWRKTYYDWGTAHEVTHRTAHEVYWAVVLNMMMTGEPGFSIDAGPNAGKTKRNACTEVDSADDGDVCNLGSINLARFETLGEFAEAVRYGTAFLLCGTLKSLLPFPAMNVIREKNRRLGLGLMGVHEWLLRRGYTYGACEELAEWMDAYTVSTQYANEFADRLGISRPVATRSIAPTGTISIVGETTSGIEPIFAVGIRRRFLEGMRWKTQYYIDPCARRLIEEGVDPSLVEDAMTLAEDTGRRLEFQAFMQQYVDHGISSTVNMPRWGSTLNNENTVKAFGENLLTVLPKLRGVTVYPDGARDGQPLTRVSYHEALPHVGKEFDEMIEGACKSGVCSS